MRIFDTQKNTNTCLYKTGTFQRCMGILFILCSFSVTLQAQYTPIPDIKFEQFLIDKNIDSNPSPDGQILTAEANAFIGFLNIPDLDIIDLTGIEAFSGMHQFAMDGNFVLSIDFSNAVDIVSIAISNTYPLQEINLTNLVNLKFFNAGLTNLLDIDISPCTNLQSFICGTCGLSDLTIGFLPNLTEIVIAHSSFGNLDLSGVPNLKSLYIDTNLMDSLDLSGVIQLEELACSYTNISSLDLSPLTQLKELRCNNSKITSLDVSMLPNLELLHTNGANLRALYMRNGANTLLTDFKAHENDDLYCISVDNAAYANANWSGNVDPQVSFTEEEHCDTDGDFVYDEEDNCITVGNSEQIDTDSDGIGNACDEDDDNDGVLDVDDNCSLIANSDQADNDSDGLGDLCDEDDDNDGVLDVDDNCSLIANSDQADNDSDGLGDLCDEDDDNDGVLDIDDNCPLKANTDQADNDGDGAGDLCDPDDDNDGVLDVDDNCPFEANTDQADNDGDGAGDLCDPDDDNDGILDIDDNCPLDANANQSDLDLDGLGDVCDPILEIDGVVNHLSSLILDLDLDKGLENSLLSILENALSSCENGHPNAAVNQLEAFINKVEAQSGKKIDETTANILIYIAQAMIEAIENGTSDCSGMEGLAIFGSNKVAVQVGIYPNPGTDLIYISEVQIGMELQVFNHIGKKVLTASYNGLGINIKSLESGVYYVNFINSDNNEVVTHKFIKL